jgi:hypothetical protein
MTLTSGCALFTVPSIGLSCLVRDNRLTRKKQHIKLLGQVILIGPPARRPLPDVVGCGKMLVKGPCLQSEGSASMSNSRLAAISDQNEDLRQAGQRQNREI